MTFIFHRLALYYQLIRLDKPIGILLLLWPTLSALWIASDGMPRWSHLFIFVLGTVLMRSAGCAINDFADRHFDKHVERTAERPLTSGKIQAWEALAVSVILTLLAFTLILDFNILTKQLSIGAVIVAGSYPYLKRFFAIPQAYLGIAFGFGIPMAFSAVNNAIPTTAWILLLANVFWALAYDTEYAMVDKEDDIKLGLKTSAITFGRFDVVAIMLSYTIALGLIGYVGYQFYFGKYFYIGLGIAALCAIYHYTLIRQRERAQCFYAFKHNNWLGAAIFAGIALDYYLR